MRIRDFFRKTTNMLEPEKLKSKRTERFAQQRSSNSRPKEALNRLQRDREASRFCATHHPFGVGVE